MVGWLTLLDLDSMTFKFERIGFGRLVDVERQRRKGGAGAGVIVTQNQVAAITSTSTFFRLLSGWEVGNISVFYI